MVRSQLTCFRSDGENSNSKHDGVLINNVDFDSSEEESDSNGFSEDDGGDLQNPVHQDLIEKDQTACEAFGHFPYAMRMLATAKHTKLQARSTTLFCNQQNH